MLLITGATGHSGSFFLKQLIDNNYSQPIRCIVRKDSDTTLLESSELNIEVVVGDLKDEVFLNKCMSGVETVIHIVNIRYTLPILKASISHNVQRLICVHTTGIYSNFRVASEEYVMLENEIREITANSKMKVSILRPTMIYGDICDHNISKFIKMIDKLRVFPVINQGKGLIQPVNARDLGKAYYDILMLPINKSNSEYILSGSKPITMLETFKMISGNLGKKTLFINVPLKFGVIIAILLKICSLGKIDYIEKVQRMSEDRCFSHMKASKDFGYRPEPFEIGLAREVKQYIKLVKEED